MNQLLLDILYRFVARTSYLKPFNEDNKLIFLIQRMTLVPGSNDERHTGTSKRT